MTLQTTILTTLKENPLSRNALYNSLYALKDQSHYYSNHAALSRALKQLKNKGLVWEEYGVLKVKGAKSIDAEIEYIKSIVIELGNAERKFSKEWEAIHNSGTSYKKRKKVEKALAIIVYGTVKLRRLLDLYP